MTQVAIAVKQPGVGLRSGVALVDQNGFRFLKEVKPNFHRYEVPGALLVKHPDGLVVGHVGALSDGGRQTDVFEIELLDAATGAVKKLRSLIVMHEPLKPWQHFYLNTLGIDGVDGVFGSAASQYGPWNPVFIPGDSVLFRMGLSGAAEPVTKNLPDSKDILCQGMARIGAQDVFLFGDPQALDGPHCLRARQAMGSGQPGVLERVTLPREDRFGRVYGASFDGAFVWLATHEGLYAIKWTGTGFDLAVEITGEPQFAVSSVQGKTAAFGAARVRRFDLHEPAGDVAHSIGGSNAYYGVAVSRDGSTVATAGTGNALQAWDSSFSPMWQQLLTDGVDTFSPVQIPVSFGRTTRQLVVIE